MRRIVKFGSLAVASLIFAGALSGCGGGSLFTPDKPDTEEEVLLGQEGRMLWQAKEQYVKIVDRDVPGLANDHPTAITSEELRTVLGSVYVADSAIIGTTQNPMFSLGELQILSPALSSGFSQVQSDEDMAFVSIGIHPSALAQERKTNTGRVFISGGRLNIIFGKIHEQYLDFEKRTGNKVDRRLNPLLPGKRSASAEPPTRMVLDEGQSFYLDPETGKERIDWIVIDIKTVLAVAAERGSGDDGRVSPELLEDVARSKQETGNLREDVGNLKGILFDMSDEIDRLKKEIEDLKEKSE
jgi:hypothetical protein